MTEKSKAGPELVQGTRQGQAGQQGQGSRQQNSNQAQSNQSQNQWLACVADNNGQQIYTNGPIFKSGNDLVCTDYYGSERRIPWDNFQGILFTSQQSSSQQDESNVQDQGGYNTGTNERRTPEQLDARTNQSLPMK